MNRRVTLRQWMFYRLLFTAGRTEGCVVPRWLYPLWFLADPMRFIQRWFGCRHRVPNFDDYEIEGLRFSPMFFLALKEGVFPGPWIRVAREENGRIEWEQQRHEPTAWQPDPDSAETKYTKDFAALMDRIPDAPCDKEKAP